MKLKYLLWKAGSLLLILYIFPGCSAEDKSSQHIKVVNGKEIATSQYPEVVFLTNESGKPLCTGTFISADTVLTAAHCTMRGKNVDPETFAVKDLKINLSQLTNQEGKVFKTLATSIAVYRHPRWTTEATKNMVNAYDIALIKFPPKTSRWFAEISERAPNRTDNFSIIGYGIDYVPGYFSRSIDISSAGIKRIGTNKIEQTMNGMILFIGGISSQDIKDGNMACASKGDSGGPMFIDGKLVGVTSGGRQQSLFGEKCISIYVDLTSKASTEFLDHFFEHP